MAGQHDCRWRDDWGIPEVIIPKRLSRVSGAFVCLKRQKHGMLSTCMLIIFKSYIPLSIDLIKQKNGTSFTGTRNRTRAMS
ncbi:hypothetical protein CCHR01_00447 [Colletotrichum chrysophilum]|uniref:Uncharacterized protein n=1 Tax=Colletotrichum chrysophilum TaxID=1836956 RepID=A0AAD9B209_9PEZI|nr:hypothetical protein CCHR01_00447 [Colletotrichum chrysophilum]